MVPFLNSASFDLRVVLFSTLLALMSGALFGALPALRFSRSDVNAILKSSSSRSSSAGSFVYDSLIVGEVALALMLVAGSGLLLLSLNRLLHADPGFDPNGIVTTQVMVPPAYRDSVQVTNFQRDLLDKLRSLPGVEGVATTDSLPLMGQGGTGSPQVVGGGEDSGREYQVDLRDVSADYFSVMKIPLVSGRNFDNRDEAQDKHVAIINRQLAADLFSGQDPIGQHVTFIFTGNTEWEIVGVVGNESVRTLDTPNLAALYFHDETDRVLNLVIRSNASTGLEPTVRAAITSLSPDIPIRAFATMQQLVAQSPVTFIHRYPAILSAGFGGLALILALVGIYGVAAYGVAQRTHELGIRIALGARSSQILDAVLRRNIVLTLAGLLLGVIGTFVVGQFLQGLLFGVHPSNPSVIIGAIALLAAVSLLASYIPARRATLVDPLVSLREQ
jgi:predicted permease